MAVGSCGTNIASIETLRYKNHTYVPVMGASARLGVRRLGATKLASSHINPQFFVKRDDDQAEAVASPLTVKDWDYDEGGQRGPKHWLEIAKRPNLGSCQSPIDLKLSDFRSLKTETPLCLVNYKMHLSVKLINTGLKFQPNTTVKEPLIHGGMLDQPYRFVQYHLHWAQRDTEDCEGKVILKNYRPIQKCYDREVIFVPSVANE
ncbi:hypothetical protein niasHT_021691 [Heterodera trifolii]|uniref:Alpha-carbonic anhydrase domain-containing protein n=1 Tax=Heterodera trifolii TaxID=157864 RepID=A0ABD2KRR5_9BILA